MLKLKLVEGATGARYYAVGSVNGVRVNRSTGCGPSAKTLAKKALKNIERELLETSVEKKTGGRKERDRASSLTVKDGAKLYYGRPKEVGATTASYVDAFVAKHADLCVVDVMPIDVTKFCQRPGLGGSTIRREINAIQGFLNFLRIGMNLQPLRIAKPQNNPPKDTKFNDDEKAKVMDACEDLHPWFVPHLNFLFATGARRSEMCMLTWGDILLDQDGQPDVVVLRSKKGARGTVIERHIPVNSTLKPILTAMRALRKPKDHHRVFFSRTGLPLDTPGLVNKVFADLVEAAGLPNLTPHDARRTFGTNLLDKDVPDIIITNLLGHVDKRMLATYAIVGADKRRQAVEKIA
jgi:integrase